MLIISWYVCVSYHHTVYLKFAQCDWSIHPISVELANSFTVVSELDKERRVWGAKGAVKGGAPVHSDAGRGSITRLQWGEYSVSPPGKRGEFRLSPRDRPHVRRAGYFQSPETASSAARCARSPPRLAPAAQFPCEGERSSFTRSSQRTTGVFKRVGRAPAIQVLSRRAKGSRSGNGREFNIVCYSTTGNKSGRGLCSRRQVPGTPANGGAHRRVWPRAAGLVAEVVGGGEFDDSGVRLSFTSLFYGLQQVSVLLFVVATWQVHFLALHSVGENVQRQEKGASSFSSEENFPRPSGRLPLPSNRLELHARPRSQPCLGRGKRDLLGQLT